MSVVRAVVRAVVGVLSAIALALLFWIDGSCDAWCGCDE